MIVLSLFIVCYLLLLGTIWIEGFGEGEGEGSFTVHLGGKNWKGKKGLRKELHLDIFLT